MEITNLDNEVMEFDVDDTFNKQTSNGKTTYISKGSLNKIKLRPQIINEHVKCSYKIQDTVTSSNIVGQIFKASKDNINGITITLESAAGEDFDDFESYANDAALQAVWVTSDEDAELETTNVYEGTQSMKLTTHHNNGNTWKRTFATTNFTGYTGEFWMYSNKEYKDVKMEVIIEDSSGNISYQSLAQPGKNQWYKFVINVDSMIGDATPADLTDIIKIGYRVKKEKRDGYVILDDLISVPGPGEVSVKLWDMGTSIPVSATTSLDDGTQYEKLGDLGITGIQASSVNIQLLGGKRLYQINEFIAGVANEIPTNETLTIGNYYAITIHYVDTNVDVYGTDPSYEIDCYPDGYAFTTPDESSIITQIGQYNDIKFNIFSTQDVYVLDTDIKIFDSDGNQTNSGEIAEYLQYIEDSNLKISDYIVTSIQAYNNGARDLSRRPMLLEKGGKIGCYYNDDSDDDVYKIVFIMHYLYEKD